MGESETGMEMMEHAVQLQRRYIPSIRPRSSLFSIALVTATLADASKAMLSVTSQLTL